MTFRSLGEGSGRGEPLPGTNPQKILSTTPSAAAGRIQRGRCTESKDLRCGAGELLRRCRVATLIKSCAAPEELP